MIGRGWLHVSRFSSLYIPVVRGERESIKRIRMFIFGVLLLLCDILDALREAR